MKLTTAEEAVKLIKSNDHVFLQGSVSTPETLVDALVARADELRNVTIYNTFAIGRRDAPYCAPELCESFHTVSFFVANNVRKAVNTGYADCIPAFLGEIPGLIRRGIVTIDAVILNVSEPDEDGYCSFGTSSDIATSATECAKVVIAQINKSMPYTYGDSRIHVSKIDACIKVDEPLVTLPITQPNEVEDRIGNYIAELIPDGATLQIGVGGIPNAVLSRLTNHKHLGLHTEALTDGVVPLLESGVIDNSQKKILPHKTVASLALGSQRLYDWMHYNPKLLMRDVAWTNDPFIIRQNPKVMAVNSALEVDITGQVCADSIGTRIFSGVGGQHDFMYGGALSEGGKIFIALPSQTKGISKIVNTLTPGAGVVTTRFQTQYVVTEYGVACLLGRTLAERAKEMIKIAHPDAREALEKAAYERYGHEFSRIY